MNSGLSIYEKMGVVQQSSFVEEDASQRGGTARRVKEARPVAPVSRSHIGDGR